MVKIILHVDLNAFFVRCEEIKNPSLENKAVIIGHTGRSGIVSTCSYKAREYGVCSGQPTFIALTKCPNAILIDGDYHYYEEMSQKFFEFLKKYTTKIEPASIDEGYIDLTDYLKNKAEPIKEIEKLQNDLFVKTDLKCSIGVAPTKFLAKMASDMKKPMGITLLRRKDIENKLYPLSIDKFFGIGKKTTPILKNMNINTIGDLANLVNKDESLKSVFGKTYYIIKDWVNGKGSDEVISTPFDPKSIGNSKTLMEDTSDIDIIKITLKGLCKEVSERAKRIDKISSNIQIVLKEAEMKNNSFKSITRSISIETPTNEFETIYKYAYALLEKNLTKTKIRLIGVSLLNLIDKGEESVQLSIFDNYEDLKEEYATKLLINELNRKMKKDVFKTARENLVEKKYGIK